MKLIDKQKIEINHWKNHPHERPEANSVHNIVNKMKEAVILLNCLDKFDYYFKNSSTILELGSGQGWASCIVKRLYPNASVIATDISKYAIASVHKWEHIFNVRIDRAKACKSYEIDEDDLSVDCIFCFQSAHHFIAHKRTLEDIYRILKPGGHCFYLSEPSVPKYWYKLAYWRVNRKRPEVPEDVLIYNKIKNIAQEVGLKCELNFFSYISPRGPIETIYYGILNLIPLLQHVLPCGINYHFSKPV